MKKFIYAIATVALIGFTSCGGKKNAEEAVVVNDGDNTEMYVEGETTVVDLGSMDKEELMSFFEENGFSAEELEGMSEDDFAALVEKAQEEANAMMLAAQEQAGDMMGDAQDVANDIMENAQEQANEMLKGMSVPDDVDVTAIFSSDDDDDDSDDDDE